MMILQFLMAKRPGWIETGLKPIPLFHLQIGRFFKTQNRVHKLVQPGSGAGWVGLLGRVYKLVFWACLLQQVLLPQKGITFIVGFRLL